MESTKIVSRGTLRNDVETEESSKFTPVRGLQFTKRGSTAPSMVVDMASEIVDLKEVVESTIETLSEVIQGESRLTIEFNTSIAVEKKGEAGVKLYLLNVGGKEASGSTGGMKIVLDTPIFPAKKNAQKNQEQ